MTMPVTDLDWLPTPTMSVLEAALAYAAHGLRVTPVHGLRDGRCTCGAAEKECKPGKHPVPGRWQHRASCIEDEVRDLFRKAPREANVGLVMGEQGDGTYLVAFDVDGDRGRERLASLEAKLGPMPMTLTSRSGREDGGEHRIFALGPGQDSRRLNNQAKLGLDVRAKNGQIVVCPSLHISGSRYSWANALAFTTLPDAWFEAIAAPVAEPRASRPPPSSRNVYNFGDRYVEKVIENAIAKISSMPEGGRNQALFATTCTVLEYCSGHGVAWESPLDGLRAAGIACGLPAREVELTVRKAVRQVERSGATRHAPPPRPRPQTQSPPPVDFADTDEGKSGSFAVSDPADEDDDFASWRTKLTTDKGRYEDCLANVITILGCHPAWVGVLQYDMFREAIVFAKEPPCREQDRPMHRPQGNVWMETDDTRTQAWIRQHLGFEPSRTTVSDAVATVAERAAFHPVREYLASLVWDGRERLPSMLVDYFGAAPSAYASGIGTSWMVSGVARVVNPGAQVDYMLVLEGEQGLGKSSAVRALLPNPRWFSDTGIVLGQKDSYLTLHGLWIYGFDELDALRGNELTKTKNFLTSTSDRLRPPYGRRMRDYPRQTIFIGTTNESEYLRDRTGNRRFWPVACTKIDVEAIRRDRDQLWAESRVRFERGEKWWPDGELLSLCKEEQAERTVSDPWVHIISGWLKSDTAQRIVQTHGGILTHDVLVNGLSFPSREVTRLDEMRVAECLRELRWEPGPQRREGGERVRRYMRPTGT